MAVPKQRKTRARTNNRRMHIFMKAPSLAACSHCGKKIKPHTICFNCGYYKNKEAIDIMGKLDKKEKKKREKEVALKEKESKKEDSLTMEGLSKK